MELFSTSSFDQTQEAKSKFPSVAHVKQHLMPTTWYIVDLLLLRVKKGENDYSLQQTVLQRRIWSQLWSWEWCSWLWPGGVYYSHYSALATLSHTTHSYYNDDLDEGDYIDLNKNNETNGTLTNPHSPSHRKAAASVCGSSATGSKRRSLPSGLMFNGATAPNALTVSLQCLLHQKSVFCFLFSVVYFQFS